MSSDHISQPTAVLYMLSPIDLYGFRACNIWFRWLDRNYQHSRLRRDGSWFLSKLLSSVRQAQYDFNCRRLRVAHICSHKKQGYLAKSGNGEADPKSPAEYKATHDK